MLSDMCDYLFKTEGHKNIVIFDWSWYYMFQYTHVTRRNCKRNQSKTS